MLYDFHYRNQKCYQENNIDTYQQVLRIRLKKESNLLPQF